MYLISKHSWNSSNTFRQRGMVRVQGCTRALQCELAGIVYYMPSSRCVNNSYWEVFHSPSPNGSISTASSDAVLSELDLLSHGQGKIH